MTPEKRRAGREICRRRKAFRRANLAMVGLGKSMRDMGRTARWVATSIAESLSAILIQAGESTQSESPKRSVE